ncbi:MAG: hypothetical protein E2604_02250 [Flavobacterium sp.]|nr:hypothetical protein [Flavobacterium sp.]
MISTYQEHSLIPENRFVFDKTTYLNKEIHLSDNKIIFDKSLQNSDVYADTLFFKDQFKARKIKDNNLTIQYPGDELNNCLVEKDSCEVGESFLRILGFKGDELMFSIFTTGEPNEYKFKLFYINHKKLALLSDNDFLLFILDKKE